MSNKYILDENGNVVPCDDLIKWAKWIEVGVRKVAKTEVVGPPVTVSTVFLGIDHQFGEGEPLLFETMVFGGQYDNYTRRYSTKEAAEKGHAEIVEKLKIGIDLHEV